MTTTEETGYLIEETPLAPDQKRAISHFCRLVEGIRTVEIQDFDDLLRCLAISHEERTQDVEPALLAGTFRALMQNLRYINKQLDDLEEDMSAYGNGEIVYPEDPGPVRSAPV
jgi:hypothetical protein